MLSLCLHIQIKVMLRICPVDGSSSSSSSNASLLTVDAQKTQVVVSDPTSSGYAISAAHRCPLPPKMFAFDAILGQNDLLVSVYIFMSCALVNIFSAFKSLCLITSFYMMTYFKLDKCRLFIIILINLCLFSQEHCLSFMNVEVSTLHNTNSEVLHPDLFSCYFMQKHEADAFNNHLAYG